MTETQKAWIRLITGFIATEMTAAGGAILASGQDDMSVLQRPSVWIAIIGAGAVFVGNSITKGPNEARAIDAEQQVKAEEKAFVKVATMTGTIPIPPDPR